MLQLIFIIAADAATRAPRDYSDVDFRARADAAIFSSPLLCELYGAASFPRLMARAADDAGALRYYAPPMPCCRRCSLLP